MKVTRRALRERAEPHFLTLSRTPREALFWTTVIIDARVVDADENATEIATGIAEQVRAFRAQWRATLKANGQVGRDGTRWAGVVEIAALHPRLMRGEKKRRLLREAFGVEVALADSQRVLVTHLHVVLDVRGHRGRQWRKDLGERWEGPWRVHSKPLFRTGTVKCNLERLASYSTKLDFRYSEAWEGRRTKLYMPMELEWRRVVEGCYAAIGLEDMVVSNVHSRAGTAPECTDRDREIITADGLSQIPESMQLSGLSDLDEQLLEEPSSSSSNNSTESMARSSEPTPRRRFATLDDAISYIRRSYDEVYGIRYRGRAVKDALPRPG